MSTSLPEAPSADTVSADLVAIPALSAELTRALLEAALDCVIVIDKQGLVVEWNEAATLTFGYERAQALGVELAELIIPERLRAAHRDGIARYLATSEPRVLGRRIETEAMRADGSELPVELAIMQVDTDRSLFVGYLRDISARRRRESEFAAASRSLEEAEVRYRTLLERLPSIAYRAGLGSEAEWKYVSPQIEEILGYTQAEWLSDQTFWEKRMHPDDVAEVIAEELRCAANGRALDVEYRIYARDGRVVWLRDRASIGVPDEDGKQRGRGAADRHHRAQARRSSASVPPRPRRPHGPAHPGVRVLELLDVVRDRGGSGTITASAGIAMATNVARVTAADLLIAADTALYEAKDAGRDRVSLFTGKNRERLELVSRVREAIEREELILYAQPLIDLRNGEVWAEELLVRMHGADGEVITAGQFIPIAESFGLIKLIDRWVVSQALDLAAQGRRTSVNLSSQRFDRRCRGRLGDRPWSSGRDAASRSTMSAWATARRRTCATCRSDI